MQRRSRHTCRVPCEGRRQLGTDGGEGLTHLRVKRPDFVRLLNRADMLQAPPRRTSIGGNVTTAQRMKHREEAFCAAKKAFLQERTIERLSAVIQAQLYQQRELERLVRESWQEGEV